MAPLIFFSTEYGTKCEQFAYIVKFSKLTKEGAYNFRYIYHRVRVACFPFTLDTLSLNPPVLTIATLDINFVVVLGQ
jgi:hypothetical protein